MSSRSRGRCASCSTRLANTQFIPPPVTALPSAAAFAAMEVERTDGKRDCYMATADISNAFYTMKLPRDMWGCFTLPPVAESGLPPALRAAAPAGRGRWLRPILRVLPMGWMWALHICQSVVEGITADTLGWDTLLRDREEARVLASSPKPEPNAWGQTSPLLSATYVDNVCVLATSKSAAAEGLQRVVCALRRHGLPVHEISEPSAHQEFIGLELLDGRVRVKPRRLWKLRYGVEVVLRRGRISGPALEVLLGHLVWHMMTVRPALSIFDAVYEHVRAHREGAGTLSRDAARELRQAAAVLPLLVADLFAPRESTVSCFDASPIAYAVCETRCSEHQVPALGRTAQLWRRERRSEAGGIERSDQCRPGRIPPAGAAIQGGDGQG